MCFLQEDDLKRLGKLGLQLRWDQLVFAQGGGVENCLLLLLQELGKFRFCLTSSSCKTTLISL